MLSRSIPYLLTSYCLGLVVLCFVAALYPWPSEPTRIVDQNDFWLWQDPPAPDFSSIQNIAERKQAFFDFFLPLIEQENRKQLIRRDLLQAIQQRFSRGHLTRQDRKQIERWRVNYGLGEAGVAQTLDMLDRRINIIPPSMVLAQAASESAWGTSRFAQEGYNYFGQWCFIEGCGLVPKQRSAGAKHEVARFHSPSASVAAYFHNINTHSAYHELRTLRQKKTQEKQPLLGHELVAKLEKYSERGNDYVKELRAIMRSNGLKVFDERFSLDLQAASEEVLEATEPDTGLIH